MKALVDFLSGLAFFAEAFLPEQSYYVRVPLNGREDLAAYMAQGYDVGGVNLEDRIATLVVPEKKLPQTRNLRVISQERVPLPDQKYKKYADVERILRDTEKTFPHLARVERIGTSIEGRDILAIRITSQFGPSNKPAILFDSMHHAREVMSAEVGLDIIDYLTKNYATDPKVKKWVNSYNIWVVPMVNPDGNNRVWTANPMWRKNRRDGHGVDNNRNYPADWKACNGSSGSPSSDTYRGASAGSEPETQALMDLAKRTKPKYNISYHSFSEIVIYPFGCSPKKIPAPDYQLYVGVGNELAKKLVRDSGKQGYTAGTCYELLYNADGGSIDHMYANERILSYVIEVNSDTQGFQPAYDRWRDVTVERQRAGWMFLLDKMADPGLR